MSRSGETSERRQDTSVSVVIPVYRASETIEACIRSLVDQTLSADRFEILTVLNGPPDGSEEKIHALAATHPQHAIRVLHSPVASAGAARNTGLDHVRGHHITFVDADDWVSTNYLEALLSATDGMRLPVAGLTDVTVDGQQNADTAVNRSLASVGDGTRLLAGSTAIAGNSVCKLYPAEWLRHKRFNVSLRSGEDLEFTTRVFESYARRYTAINVSPYLAGARYFRRLTDNSISRQPPTYDFSVTQRIQVIQELMTGRQQHPTERTSMAQLMIAAQAGFIRRYLAENPEEALEVTSDLEGAELPADEILPETTVWPSYESAWSPESARGGQRFVLLAGSAQSLNSRSPEIRVLHRAYPDLRLAYVTGTLTKSLTKFGSRRFEILPEPTGDRGTSRWQRRIARLRRVGQRGIPFIAPASLASGIVHRTDPAAKNYLQGRTALSVDGPGSKLADRFDFPESRVSSFDGWVLAAAALKGAGTPLMAKGIRRAAGRLADDLSSEEAPPPSVWVLAAWRLIRGSFITAGLDVLTQAEKIHPYEMSSHGAGALRILAEIAGGAESPVSLSTVAAETMKSADDAWTRRDVDKSVFLTYLVMEMLMHPDLHASVEQPPLLTHEEHLRPLTQSSVGRLLMGALPSRAEVERNQDGSRADLLVLPGTFPKFTGVVIEALGSDITPRILDLHELGREFKYIALGVADVANRMSVNTGKPRLSLDLIETIARHRTIFADWADSGAMAASWFAAPGSRLIVRFHGIDTLGAKQLLIDWSRVTDLVFVSEHLRQSVLKILGDKIAHCRHHVIGNIVDFDRFDLTPTADAHRRLGMVGWAQRVKDPLWTVEVLARLRAADPSWKLRLIGQDFSPGRRRAEAEYAERFRTRVLEPDVAGGIEYIGYTKNLPYHVAGVGFAVSSSLRESWHVGAMEMVASSAVPVVRDWPVYQDLGGAAGVYGTEWVVRTPEEAAERILGMADREDWLQHAEEARDSMGRRYAAEALRSQYRDLLTEPPPRS